MEWNNDTKNGYDDLEVNMEYGYVFVSSIGRNHAKMAYSLFNLAWHLKQPIDVDNFARDFFETSAPDRSMFYKITMDFCRSQRAWCGTVVMCTSQLSSQWLLISFTKLGNNVDIKVK